MPELPSLPDFSDIPLRLRVWWAGASRRKRIWTVVISAVCLFFLFRLAGCGSSVSQESALRSGGDEATALLLDKAKQAIADKEVVSSESPTPRVEVIYGRKEGLLLISTPSGDSIIQKDGLRLNADPSGCFYGGGQAPSPSPGAVVLPLSEPSARFSEPDRQGDFTYLPFESQRLGNWQAGAGSLVLDSDNLPVAFNYTMQGQSQEYRFRISYPDKLPEVKVKRCS